MLYIVLYLLHNLQFTSKQFVLGVDHPWQYKDVKYLVMHVHVHVHPCSARVHHTDNSVITNKLYWETNNVLYLDGAPPPPSPFLYLQGVWCTCTYCFSSSKTWTLICMGEVTDDSPSLVTLSSKAGVWLSVAAAWTLTNERLVSLLLTTSKLWTSIEFKGLLFPIVLAVMSSSWDSTRKTELQNQWKIYWNSLYRWSTITYSFNRL